MVSALPHCPNCNHPLENKTDVVCLQCGARLKGAPAKSFRPKKSSPGPGKTVPDGRTHPSKPGSSFIKVFLSRLFSALFLGITLVFAYAYLFDFSLLYRIPESLALRGQTRAAARVLEAYRFMALSRELPGIAFRLKQYRLEIRASGDPPENALIPLRIMIADRFVDADGTAHLKLSVTNATPVAVTLDTRFFYLKDEARLLFPLAATPKRNMGPAVLAPWKTVHGGLRFPAGMLSPASEKSFSGKIVFNNGRKYAIRPVKFSIPSERSRRSENWSAR